MALRRSFVCAWLGAAGCGVSLVACAEVSGLADYDGFDSGERVFAFDDESSIDPNALFDSNTGEVVPKQRWVAVQDAEGVRTSLSWSKSVGGDAPGALQIDLDFDGSGAILGGGAVFDFEHFDWSEATQLHLWLRIDADAPGPEHDLDSLQVLAVTSGGSQWDSYCPGPSNPSESNCAEPLDEAGCFEPSGCRLAFDLSVFIERYLGQTFWLKVFSRAGASWQPRLFVDDVWLQ